MSKGEAGKEFRKMPVRGAASQEDSAESGLAELAHLVRQAFEEKNRRQALALTSAILKIDRHHKTALVIQEWILEDQRKELSKARVQIEEARREKNLASWDRSERLLRGVLSIDPDCGDAKNLLAEVIPAQEALAEKRSLEPEPDPEPVEPIVAPPAALQVPSTRMRYVAFGALLLLSIVVFIFIKNRALPPEPAQAKSETDKEKPPVSASTGSFELLVLPAQGVEVAVDDARPQPVTQTMELPAGLHKLVFTAARYSPKTISETIVAGERRVLPVIMSPIVDASASTNDPKPADRQSSRNNKTPPAGAAQETARNSRPNSPPPAVAKTGRLAINAAVPADVYLRGKQLGTTPLTVDLPPGMQTLEYRYLNMTQTVSHQIISNQTTRATIAFEVNVKINARPWAQVSIEGVQGGALGQTPLSDVTVAAGSVLIFQNPAFPAKRYRVTGKDRAIQIVFP